MIDKAGMLAFFLVFLWTGAYTGDVREAEEGAAGHAAAVETALSTEDVRAPELGSLSFRTADGEKLHVSAASEGEYGCFFREGVTVTVEIKDPEPSSGLDAITWMVCRSPGMWQSVEQRLGGKGSETASLYLPEGFKGWIRAEVSDRAGNRSGGDAVPVGLVLESESYHKREEHLEFFRPETEYRDEGGRDLYDEGISLELQASDSFSGIARVEWKIRGAGSALPDYGEEGALESGPDGELFGDEAEQWTVTGRDGNLITAMERRWMFEEGSGIAVRLRLWDRAGNCTEKEEVFSIDCEAPAVTLAVCGAEENPEHPGFYPGTWKGRICIRDRNPNAAQTEVRLYRKEKTTGAGVWREVPGSQTGEQYGEEWEADGEWKKYEKLMECPEDGEYLLKIRAADLAGHESETRTAAFTVDTRAPDLSLEMSGPDGRIPVLSVFDQNPDGESMHITLSGEVHGTVELKMEQLEKEREGVFRLPEFPEAQKWDDCYTLRASAEDLAGNRAEAELFFRVNRFGSVYGVPEPAEALQGRYIREAEEICLLERNPGPLETVRLEVVRNGISRTLQPGKDYRTERDGGETEWNTYCYYVEPGVFEKEGIYQIRVFSVDRDGNRNTGGGSMETGFPEFGVDRTAPDILILAEKDETGIYRFSEDAVFRITDNFLLESVEFYVDGIKTEPEERNGCWRISGIAESVREITVMAGDAAGNTSRVKVKGIFCRSVRRSGSRIPQVLLASGIFCLAASVRTAAEHMRRRSARNT